MRPVLASAKNAVTAMASATHAALCYLLLFSF